MTVRRRWRKHTTERWHYCDSNGKPACNSLPFVSDRDQVQDDPPRYFCCARCKREALRGSWKNER